VVEVVDDDEVEPAVAVVIDEADGGGPQRIPEPGLIGDVLELAAAPVQEQLDAGVLGDDDVGQAVVVDVADGHAGVVAADPQAGTLRHVLELAAAQVPVQPVDRGRAGAAGGEEVDVEQTVAVEVEQGHAGAVNLRQLVAAQVAGVVDE